MDRCYGKLVSPMVVSTAYGLKTTLQNMQNSTGIPLLRINFMNISYRYISCNILASHSNRAGETKFVAIFTQLVYANVQVHRTNQSLSSEYR